MKRQAGFTLIGVIIAIAIVAILAGISYPIYLRYVNNSRRTSAITALQRAAAAEEKHYAAYNAYATSLTTLSYSTNTVAIPSSTQHWYDLSASKDTSGGSPYKLTAKPVGAQATDKCGTFILTGTGAKKVSNSTGMSATKCWSSG